jgi:hypothetical protein
VCRRKGYFINSNGDESDWREAMRELVLKPVNRTWAKVFSDGIEKHHVQLEIDVLRAFDDFGTALQQSVWEICGKEYGPARRVFGHIRVHGDAFLIDVKNASRTIKKASRGCQNKIEPVIDASMEPAYLEVMDQKGNQRHTQTKYSLMRDVLILF